MDLDEASPHHGSLPARPAETRQSLPPRLETDSPESVTTVTDARRGADQESARVFRVMAHRNGYDLDIGEAYWVPRAHFFPQTGWYIRRARRAARAQHSRPCMTKRGSSRMWSLCSWLISRASTSAMLSPTLSSARSNRRTPTPQSTSRTAPAVRSRSAFPELPLPRLVTASNLCSPNQRLVAKHPLASCRVH